MHAGQEEEVLISFHLGWLLAQRGYLIEGDF